jgi:N-acetylneuraminic acid mutarotase
MKASRVVFLVFLIILSLCIVNVQPVKATENSWTTKTQMPTARSGLGLAVVDDKIYAIGGYYGDKNEEYGLVADTWTTKKPMPTPRGDFAIAVFGDKIYTFGGLINAGQWTTELTDVNEVYDPATDTWTTKTSMPTPKAGSSASVVDGKIYLIGGFTYSAGTHQTSNENLVYDPLADSWTTKTSIPTPTLDYATAVVDNKIYVISGTASAYSDNLIDLNQIYDPKTDTWSQGTPIPVAVQQAAASATTGVNSAKAIYVMGGFTGFYWPRNLTQVYHPESDTWSSGADMPTPLFDLGVAVVKDQLYAIGGMTGFLRSATAENNQYTPFGYETVPPDTTPPTVSIVSPENKTYTVNNVSLTFTVSEQTSWIGYSLDGQDNVTITGNITLSGLSNGLHNLTVYANDAAGNTGTSETIYFTIAQKIEPPPQSSESFPTTWIVTAIAIIAIGAAAGYLIYKRRR